MIGFELASSPAAPPAEPAYVSGAQAGDVRLSGSMTLSRPAPGVRFSAVAITTAGSLSWKGEVSCWAPRNARILMIKLLIEGHNTHHRGLVLVVPGAFFFLLL